LFEPNVGQADRRVKFVTRASGYVLYLTDTAAVLELSPNRSGSRQNPSRMRVSEPSRVVRMTFVNAQHGAAAVGLDELPGKVNYFQGDDPTRWRRSVPTYGRVKYRDIYPGVDVVYYGRPGSLEYDLIVAPGTDPKAILLALDGADSITIDAQGDLILHTA